MNFHEQNNSHEAQVDTVEHDGAEEQVDTTVLKVTPRAHLTNDDLEGLPEELMKELGLSESDRKEFLIVELIDKSGGVISLNKLLVEIYNETSEIEKRTRLSSRLNRMQKKGLIYSVPKNKGVYSTTPIENTAKDEEDDEEEVDQLLENLLTPDE